MGEISIDPKFNIHETYKKVRILNPYRNASPIGGVDPDYQAVLDYASGNFIALPDAAQQDIDNQFIINYKASGAWDLDDVVLRFKGTATPAFKLICWKRRIEAQAFGGLTWSDSGVLGNGTTGYIDPLFIPANGVKYTLNDASVAFSTFNIGTSGGNKTIAGSWSGANNGYILIIPNNGGSSHLSINQFKTTTAYAKLGYTSVNRISSSLISLDTTDITNSSGQLSTAKVYILARSLNNTADLFSDAGLGFISFGASKRYVHDTVKILF